MRFIIGRSELLVFSEVGFEGREKGEANGSRYHDENTKLEDLIHPEDIEHFQQHDDLEDEADRVAALDKMPIVEQNIPSKFRRDEQ